MPCHSSGVSLLLVSFGVYFKSRVLVIWCLVSVIIFSAQFLIFTANLSLHTSVPIGIPIFLYFCLSLFSLNPHIPTNIYDNIQPIIRL